MSASVARKESSDLPKWPPGYIFRAGMLNRKEQTPAGRWGDPENRPLAAIGLTSHVRIATEI
jgi:hypothetical protein